MNRTRRGLLTGLAIALLCGTCLVHPVRADTPEGALTRVTITPRPAANVGISAAVLWTDRRGGVHPLAGAWTEVRNTHEQVLSATLTDEQGRMSAVIPWQDGGPTGPGLFLRVYAAGPGAFVTPQGAGGPEYAYHVDATPGRPSAGTNLHMVVTVGYDQNGRPTQSDPHTAFSVFQGVRFAATYIREMAQALPDLAIRFPDRSRGSTAYQRGELHIIRQDRWDWDILQHEYGHYASHALGITATPGGPHHWWNISERYGKPKGIPLAWSEGWATYFPVQVQAHYQLAAWQIPGVGDTVYQDTEDQELAVDLASTQPAYRGEDSEFAIARILWALSTGRMVGNERDLLHLFTQTHATSLSEAYQAMVQGQRPVRVAQIGCVLAAHGVAPRLTLPAAESGVSRAQAPRFTWEPNGGGPTRRNNQFWVEFYDGSFRLIGSSQPLSRPSFTPAPGQWSSIVRYGGGKMHVMIKGAQLDEPITGPYAGCATVLHPTAP